MRRIRAILFDKDGTLFDFHASWGGWAAGFIRGLAPDAEAADRLADAMGYDLHAERFRPNSPVIAGSVDDWAGVALTALPGLDRATLVDRILRESAEAPMVPAAPLRPLLTRLAGRGLALGVATNDGAAPLARHLAEAGIADLFGFAAGSDSGYGQKPAPGQLLAFAAHADAHPAEVLMVGDSTHDLIAARAAGMPAVAVLTGMAPAEELAPLARAVLPSVARLPDWLDRG